MRNDKLLFYLRDTRMFNDLSLLSLLFGVVDGTVFRVQILGKMILGLITSEKAVYFKLRKDKFLQFSHYQCTVYKEKTNFTYEVFSLPN